MDNQHLLGAKRSKLPPLAVEFDFIIESGNESFTTRLNGLLNPKTGKVFMDAFVSTGYYEGAHVEKEGRLVDPATLKFVGSLKLIPRK